MLISADWITPTTARWAARAAERARAIALIRAGRPLEADAPDRVRSRLDRLAEQGGLIPTADGPRLVGLERVLGRDDLVAVNFLERGAVVARSVARIELRTRAGQTIGYGTGFLVGPRLLLTNFHVLSTGDEAALARAEFDYCDDAAGRPLRSFALGLRPDVLFLADRSLDYALVALDDPEGRLAGVWWNPLLEATGKVVISDYMTIIQHPNGEPKQIALRGNQLVDVLDLYLHYEADTSPGSSGSPVYNDAWELVALHHSGVPRTNAQGEYLKRDGSVWQEGEDDSLIDWVANEGVRVSRIVRSLKGTRMTDDKARLVQSIFEQVPVVSRSGGAERQYNELGGAGSEGRLVIPLEITIRVAGAAALAPRDAVAPLGPLAPDTGGPAAAAGAEEKVSIDPDYSTRPGYEPGFLGTGKLAVPLPRLSESQRASVARNTAAPAGADDTVLPYHHYSVVFNKSRKVAFFTAVNIDGKLAKKIEREADKWFYDPRIPREVQAGESVYTNNPLDRGHLVRRLDPAWGSTTKVARVANDDTFHFTNCSPQHHDFNAGKNLWAGVEDYILNSAKNNDLKVSVFTGPILKRNDPPYRGIRLPLQFWKVVVMRTAAGTLHATGYLLSQAQLIADMPEEEFAFGAYKTFQMPIAKLEKLTGLDFGDLPDHDPLATAPPPGPQEAFRAETGALELGSFEDVKL